MIPQDAPVEVAEDPIDRRVIQLRAYVAPKRKRRSYEPEPNAWTSGVCVIFDTETFIDPSQRLRYGAYQVRAGGDLLEVGVFHADDLDPQDQQDLARAHGALAGSIPGVPLRLISRAEFVERVIYKWGFEARGLIVGFNLPFDLSRIAIDHTYGKGGMTGGFSFTLAEKRPALRIKHRSARSAFINFAGAGPNRKPDRGFFVDVKTLAAALTGQAHSLEGLTELLGVTPKKALDDYAGPIMAETVAYCLNDVQATWECFDALADRYAKFGLERTGLHELYSEASLGKAYLQAMGVQPWTKVQADAPPELIGVILSTYYGGRAEVHLRREITSVIHCDFLSMYPTVCTLMGLWRFVVAEGMTWADATDDVRQFVERCGLDSLSDPETWGQLHAIVQIEPDDDVLPVRAFYEADQPATIGVNRLTHAEPMWFTLADVLAAKLLGGKVPKIVRAIRFQPGPPQKSLRPIQLEGVEVQPACDDFYKLLIDQRRRIQAQEDTASGAEKARLKAAQQGLKILANSTSYGIFVELNIEALQRSERLTCYDFRGKGRPVRSSKIEKPGRYFHPLLGTLITGAARLMLACAERNALDRGMDWAFCDTDSLAIANTSGLTEAEFIDRVEGVRSWFEPLNPYEVTGSILQLEKVNFPEGAHNDPEQLRPLHCLPISAKRYVLFDRDDKSQPVIRKASRHGLGHFVPPYKDPDRERIGRVGVQLWQADLWTAIICAYDDGRPDQPRFSRLSGLSQPAPTRYSVTNPTLLKWFSGYNAKAATRERVGPFNFLLTFQAKSLLEMTAADPAGNPWPKRKRPPSPASRYSSDLQKDRPDVFDRITGEPVPWDWLRSYHRSLAAYHLHSESKFRGGEGDERGRVSRRHVRPWIVRAIGKEADNLDEREALGEEDADPVDWDAADDATAALRQEVVDRMIDLGLSDRTLAPEARVSHHTLADLREGRSVPTPSLLRIADAVEGLARNAAVRKEEAVYWLQVMHQLKDQLGGGNQLADKLRISRPHVHRMLNGERPVSSATIRRLRDVRSHRSLSGTSPRR